MKFSGIPNKILVFIILILITTTISAQQNNKPAITVLSIDASVVSPEEAKVFEDYLTSHLFDTNNFRVIDRKQRETALEEINFSFSGASDSEKQLEIGKLLSVQYVIVGSLGKIGSNYLLNLKMIEVETGETISTVSERYESMDILLDDSKSNIFELAGIAHEKKSTTKEPMRGSSIELGMILVALGTTEGYVDEYWDDDNEWYPPDYIFGGVFGYTYNFSKILALGGVIRIFQTLDDYYGDTDSAALSGAVKVIIGDKNDGLAGSVCLGYPFPFFTLGAYYRNFYVNAYVPFYGTDRYIEFLNPKIGIEVGYSLYLPPLLK